MNRKTSFKKKIIISVLGVAVVLVILSVSKVGYYLVCRKAAMELEKLNLPPNCEVFCPTTACVSDVYWVHVRAEKIVYCDEGKDYIEQYMKDNNSESSLEDISVYDVTGESDTDILDFYRFSKEDQDKIMEVGEDKYAHIVYFKEKLWFPMFWYKFENIVVD
ncbi:MAG: hypothetical protein J5802_10815 [Butyrivibrio sp.]|nr:hypothetical protein [Butyrivibrio sp.]